MRGEVAVGVLIQSDEHLTGVGCGQIHQRTRPAHALVDVEPAVAVDDVHDRVEERPVAFVEGLGCFQQACGERGFVFGFADTAVVIGVGLRGEVVPQLQTQVLQPLAG
jgi:hypothetical protein